MASDMWLYWEARGHLTEGRRRLDALLEAHRADDRVRAKALWVAGYLALGQTDVEAAIPLLQRSLELAEATGDSESAAFATQYLGLCRLFVGDLVGAAELLEEAVQRHQTNRQRAAAFALSDVAVIWMLEGELGRAIATYKDLASQ